jgi:ABC-2 type transport system ATP-binding protein
LETILTLNNLTKKFGSLTAVKNLSFTIKKGNVYGILGPNGSGKSTTLGMVLNVVNKTSGDFHWFDGSESTHEALKKVGRNYRTSQFLSIYDSGPKSGPCMQDKGSKASKDLKKNWK